MRLDLAFLVIIAIGKTTELSVDLKQNIIDCHKTENTYFCIFANLRVPRSIVQSGISYFALFVTEETLSGEGLKQKLSERSA